MLERHVVLIAPEVHWNTGNIGRTCLGVGAALHLVRPLGFSLSDRHVRRAGLDYWPRVALHLWDDFPAFLAGTRPAVGEVAIFSALARSSFWEMPRPPRQFLIFGSESQGLPSTIRAQYADAAYRIPVSTEIRSLNLSTAVGIALYESLRQTR